MHISMTFDLASFEKWILLLAPILEQGQLKRVGLGNVFRVTQLKPRSWGAENRGGINIWEWGARTHGWEVELSSCGEVGSEGHHYHPTPI